MVSRGGGRGPLPDRRHVVADGDRRHHDHAFTRLHDHTSTSDQFFPTLSVGSANIVSVTWYDRRQVEAFVAA